MEITDKILCWYDRRQRSLPWRQSRDPYSIWVSEIMLQQTRVEVVIPYYRGFLEQFPTVEVLAEAPLEDVLARWSGLGYYRRARQLHSAAERVVELGGIPRTARELRELPGIGPYTSAAIASIAFGEVVPVLDGNVERLFCRFFAIEEDPKKAVTRRYLLKAAEAWLDELRPGDSNQALMELGATICRPKRPKCSECPIARECKGRLLQDPERFPSPRRRRSTEIVELAVAVIREGERVLFFKRSQDHEVMPGLWELPNAPREQSRRSMEQFFSKQYGGSWRLHAVIRQVRHSITYRAITLHVYGAEVDLEQVVVEGVPESAWIADADRHAHGMSSMVEKVLGNNGSSRDR